MSTSSRSVQRRCSRGHRAEAVLSSPRSRGPVGAYDWHGSKVLRRRATLGEGGRRGPRSVARTRAPGPSRTVCSTARLPWSNRTTRLRGRPGRRSSRSCSRPEDAALAARLPVLPTPLETLASRTGLDQESLRQPARRHGRPRLGAGSRRRQRARPHTCLRLPWWASSSSR